MCSKNVKKPQAELTGTCSHRPKPPAAHLQCDRDVPNSSWEKGKASDNSLKDTFHLPCRWAFYGKHHWNNKSEEFLYKNKIFQNKETPGDL